MGPPPKKQEAKKELSKPTGEAKRQPKEATPLENAKTQQEILAERCLQELRSKVRKQVSAAVIQYPFVGRNMKFDEDRIFLRIFSDGRFLFRRPAGDSKMAAPPGSVLMDTFEGVMRNFKEWEEYLEGVTDADSTTAEIDLQAMLKVTEAWPKSWTYTEEEEEPGMVAPQGAQPLQRVRTLHVEEATHVVHFALVPFFMPEYAVLSEDAGAAVLGPRKGSRVPPRRLQMGLTVASFAGEEPESSVWLPCTGADAVFPGPSKPKKAFPPGKRSGGGLGQSMSMGALETVTEGFSSGKSPASFGLSAPGFPRRAIPFEGQTASLITSMNSSLLGRTQSGSSPIQRRLGEKRRQFFGGLTAYEETRQKGQFLSTVIDSLRPEVHPGNQLMRKTFSAPKDLSEQLTILRPLDAAQRTRGDAKKGASTHLSQEAWVGRQSFGAPQHRSNPRAALAGQTQIPGISLPNFGTIGGGGRGSVGSVQSSHDPSGARAPSGGNNDWSAFYKNRSQQFLRGLPNA